MIKEELKVDGLFLIRCRLINLMMLLKSTELNKSVLNMNIHYHELGVCKQWTGLDYWTDH